MPILLSLSMLWICCLLSDKLHCPEWSPCLQSLISSVSPLLCSSNYFESDLGILWLYNHQWLALHASFPLLMLFPPSCYSPGLLHWWTLLMPFKFQFKWPLGSLSELPSCKICCSSFCIPIVLSKFLCFPLAQLSSEWKNKEWMNKSALWLILFLCSWISTWGIYMEVSA